MPLRCFSLRITHYAVTLFTNTPDSSTIVILIKQAFEWGLIYYLTNTATKYYRTLIETYPHAGLINSCYCDISPVQWQIFQ